MFVTLVAMVLASNGPVCKAFCDTDVYEKRIAACQGTVEELEKDVEFCKEAYIRLRNKSTDMINTYVEKAQRLETQLAECQAKKVKPKKKAVKKTVVVVKEETKPCCQVAPAPVTVVNNVTVKVEAAAAASATATKSVSLWDRERPSYLLGIRGAGGAAVCAPTGIGLLGVRLNYLPIHLGLDVYTEFYHGTGVQVLAYPVQTLPFMWHLNAGVIGFSGKPFVTPDLPRQIDLTLGTGIEFRVLPFLWVTADLQARMANPVAISQTGQKFGTVLGKSLLQTQGMVGLLLRTW